MVSSFSRLVVNLPDNLVREIDDAVRYKSMNRSALIEEATKTYLMQTKRQIIESMIKGYAEMASLNLMIAEYGFSADVSSLQEYERKMEEID